MSTLPYRSITFFDDNVAYEVRIAQRSADRMWLFSIACGDEIFTQREVTPEALSALFRRDGATDAFAVQADELKTQFSKQRDDVLPPRE